MSSTVGPDWYHLPLSFDDIVAGGFLVFVTVLIYPVYIIVIIIMLKHDKEIIGFRYLFSSSIVNMLLMLNYSLWPGITILFKSEITPPHWRSGLQIYMDWVWFCSCYHYMLIAWTRYAAIRHPTFFRSQTKLFSYGLCACCYLCSLIQVMSTHFQSWYVTFYYNPEVYGMSADDFIKYLTQGQSLFFLFTHIVTTIVPLTFYGISIWFLYKNRKTANVLTNTAKAMSVEAKLILPCIFNTIIFIIGQVVITLGTGSGKWASWTVLVLFTCNAAFNPFLLIFFSKVIRQRVLTLLHGESGVTSSVARVTQRFVVNYKTTVIIK